MQDGGSTDEPFTPGITPSSGSPHDLGVTPDEDGVNVAVFSAHADEILFCIYDAAGDHEQSRFVLPERTGDVHHGHIHGIRPGTRYGLRARGPWAPWAGHRFNEHKLLIDPYATALDRLIALDPAMFDAAPGDGKPDLRDSGTVVPKGIVGRPDLAMPWGGASSWERTSILELHVRGFSMLNPAVPEAIRGTFAGLAAEASIAHLQKLGITTIELMPAMTWADERHLGPLGLTNYWGYNPIGWFAPDPRLAPGGWAEVREAVTALHAAGIEVLLDVVYNHSGEGDEFGPTLSLRGLDNASYYRLADDPARYINDAGCGNILSADQPAVVRLVLDSLRAWARYGGIDGFRFDLAPVLGRRPGFDPHAPILAAIEQDPILRRLKLIAEAWDIGPGGYQVGRFGGAWGEWNDTYRDAVRRFWSGRGGPAELAGRLCGSSDLFGAKRHPSRGVNFVTAHDGFTLADVVAYAHKHNDANGEGNRDGRDENWSWNHGIEGPTEEPAILAGRARDERNLLATLLLSRGTPMLGPGTELGQTQSGNNNAYSQDNPISWLDWSKPDHALTGFVRRLLDLRAAHPALTHDRFLAGSALPGTDLADVAWRMADGRAPGPNDWQHPPSATLIAALAAPGRDPGAPLDRVLVAIHAGEETLRVDLPEPRPGWRWVRALDTADPENEERDEAITADLGRRAIGLFVEREGTRPAVTRAPSSDEVVGTLAAAAGVAAEWFAVSGDRHEVSLDSKRAILAAMGLPATTLGEARDGLAHLSDRRLRALPPTLVGYAGAQITLDLIADGLPERPGLVIRREDGSEERILLDDHDSAERVAIAAPDGRAGVRCRVPLPPQPMGRHRLMLDGDPDRSSLLTVAPHRCFIPPEYRAGRRGFGVAAHLYTLKRKRDGGIGDFSTLGIFAEETARHGGDFVGLNPMHAQFAQDRGRSSPYNPSDRRFLDPIYIDVSAPEVLKGASKAAKILDQQAAALAALRDLPAVDYPAVWAAKSAVLEAAFKPFDKRQSPAFDDFVVAGGETLRRFAIFEAICETVPRLPWQLWEPGLATPTAPGVADFAERNAKRVRYHLYLQWIAARQFAQAGARGEAAGLSLGFYRDIAVGTAPDGAEAWTEAGNFARGVSVGAPPDPFSADGQVWSLPPPNPVAEPSDMFAHLLATNMRHAGALRIDHAMGLQRLFWVPDGARGAEGAYVGYDLERNLADVALESHRAKCLVIGEDLGTVPDGFRDRLDAADVLSYRVLFFERHGLRFQRPHEYPVKAVACVATHDLATLHGWWAGADYAERAALGLTSAEDGARAAADRSAERRELAEVLGIAAGEGETVPAGLAEAAHDFVGNTPCLLAVAQAEDLVGEPVAVNLPGTSHQRPNWQRKLAPDVTEIFRVAGGTLPKRGPGVELEA